MDSSASPSPSVADPLADQPIERVSRDGVDYVLLGTAHVSRASVAAVEALLEREAFDAVAVELCENRARAMRDPAAFAQMDLFQVIRQGKAGMVAASLALSAFQRRLAEQFGIEPGAEMKAAMQGADQRSLPTWLVDRDVGVTLKRTWRSVGFKDKLGILAGLVGGLFERDGVAEDDIEKLKQGDLLESAFREFAEGSQSLYAALIGERDAFMAARLREEAARAPAVRRVLVVIGAGHLAGLRRHLEGGDAADLAALNAVPPAARWPKWVALGLVVAIFAAIAVMFHRDASLGTAALRDWVLFTGGLSALAAIIARAHPLSVLTAFVAGPLKPIRPPGLSSGVCAALAEAWLRKPRVADFEHLREDLVDWRGWWRNRVAQTLLVFVLVNLGTIAGEYIAGFRILKALL